MIAEQEKKEGTIEDAPLVANRSDEPKPVAARSRSRSSTDVERTSGSPLGGGPDVSFQQYCIACAKPTSDGILTTTTAALPQPISRINHPSRSHRHVNRSTTLARCDLHRSAGRMRGDALPEQCAGAVPHHHRQKPHGRFGLSLPAGRFGVGDVRSGTTRRQHLPPLLPDRRSQCGRVLFSIYARTTVLRLHTVHFTLGSVRDWMRNDMLRSRMLHRVDLPLRGTMPAMMPRMSALHEQRFTSLGRRFAPALCFTSRAHGEWRRGLSR